MWNRELRLMYEMHALVYENAFFGVEVKIFEAIIDFPVP